MKQKLKFLRLKQDGSNKPNPHSEYPSFNNFDVLISFDKILSNLITVLQSRKFVFSLFFSSLTSTSFTVNCITCFVLLDLKNSDRIGQHKDSIADGVM